MSVQQAEGRSDVDFDPASLRGWLARAMPALTGEMRLDRIGGGQSNPTYFVTIGDTRMVLRKRPPGDLPKSAHDVGREYRIISALADSAVPVPEAIAYREDGDVVGTPFYLMGRIDGRIFHDASLPEVAKTDRRSYYREHAQRLAALHAVDWQAGDLAAFARPGSFLQRQVDRWTRAWGDLATDDAEVARVARWLAANIPAQEDVAIVHGDFKFTNVIFDPVAPMMTGVLDWELCTIGDPLTDVAHIWSALWETGPDEYGGLMGLDLDAQGLPDADEYFGYYYEAARSDRRLTPFHLALGHFRNAGIFHGIRQRAEAGIANAANAEATGRMDKVYIARALAIAVANGG